MKLLILLFLFYSLLIPQFSNGSITLAQKLKGESTVVNAERKFTFEKKYLNFPVKNDAPSSLIRIIINDEIIREFDITLAPSEPDFWVYLELKDFFDKEGILRIDTLDNNVISGFRSIYQDDTFPGESDLYKERLRPQFHFSSK